MNDSDFEKHLQRQPLRQIPQEWRSEILQNAAASAPSSRRSTAKRDRPSLLSTINHQLSTILWPHPKAWAALAAAWVLIFALRFASQDNRPNLAKTSSPPSQEIVNLKEQQQILAELIGSSTGTTPEIDRPKRFMPQPHSERRTATAMA